MAKTKDQTSGTFDVIIEQLGQLRKFHIINFTLIYLATFLTGLQAAAYIFIADEVDYRCHVPECESLAEINWTSWAFPFKDNHLDKCTRYAAKSNSSSIVCSSDWFDNATTVACDQFVYGLNGDSSIVKDFNLGCQEWKRTLVGSVYNAGFLISITLSGIFSDRYGRKLTLALSAFVEGVFGFSRSFTSNYQTFTVLQFLETAIGGGTLTSTFILLMEIVTPNNRILGQSVHTTIFSLGMAALGGLAWIIPDWRTLLRIIYIPFLSIIVYIWILDESVRWLLVKNRHKDAMKVIRKAEKLNRVTIPETLKVELYQRRQPSNKENRSHDDEKFIDSKSDQTSIVKRIFRSPILIKQVLSCSFLWITCTFTFYGLSTNSVRLTDNRHLSFIIIILSQIPAYLTSYLIMDRIGRRKTLIAAFVVCGLSCITSAFTPKDIFMIALIPYVLGKYAISLAFVTIYMYTSEIFPTSLRQSLLGTCSTVGRFGSLLAPQVQLIAYYMEPLPSILFGSLALISAILSYILPETAKVRLPDTIEEAESMYKK